LKSEAAPRRRVARGLLRYLVWNAILGLVALWIVRTVWLPRLPLVWPLVLAAVFGFPGVLLSVLLWFYLGQPIGG
jgi:hypothetical protein